jgi:uncharacterized protein (DUF427 family)
MGKSPAHQQHPEHKVMESKVEDRARVEAGGEFIADSTNVIKVEEDGNPVRYYFPRADVRMEKLERSDLRTTCPFKGSANYFNLVVGGRKLANAVWSYEDPYEEHAALKGRLAFYSDKMPEIGIVFG